MGGSSNGPIRTRGPGPVKGPEDPCDIALKTDLVGVTPAGLSGVKVSQILSVTIVASGNTKSVVCVDKAGKVVGSLAAVRGLAQLISCLESGVEFEAIVQSVSKTNCNVLVQRP